MAKQRPLDHWVVIPDKGLKLILDGPPAGASEADLWEWADRVQDLVEDGLETA